MTRPVYSARVVLPALRPEPNPRTAILWPLRLGCGPILVGHADDDISRRGIHIDADDPSLRCELHRVGEQIAKNLRETLGIAVRQHVGERA